jgi:hypothetical protein
MISAPSVGLFVNRRLKPRPSLCGQTLVVLPALYRLAYRVRRVGTAA